MCIRDRLSRIAEVTGDIPIQPRADYDVCVRAGDVPLRQAEFFKITDLSISPSRIIPGDEVFEEEKEILKTNVKGALSKFRQARLEILSKLYSPDEAVQQALDKMELEGDLPEILAEAKKKLSEDVYKRQVYKQVGNFIYDLVMMGGKDAFTISGDPTTRINISFNVALVDDLGLVLFDEAQSAFIVYDGIGDGKLVDSLFIGCLLYTSGNKYGGRI